MPQTFTKRNINLTPRLEYTATLTSYLQTDNILQLHLQVSFLKNTTDVPELF